MKRFRLSSLALGFALGVVLTMGSVAFADDGVDIIYRKLEVLAQVLANIENHYVDAVSATDLVYGAAKGAVAVLDEHSTFFTPAEYKDLLDMTEGEYAGIGIELGWDKDLPHIIAVLDGSAAARAGLRVGDELASVDGVSLVDMNLDMVETRLRGPVGSKVVLGVHRADRDDEWKFTLVRSWVRVAPVESHALASGVMYVQVKTFSRRVASDLAALLKRTPPNRGLVLDLRGNPGGLFDEAVDMCDLFLADGPIVMAVGRGGRIIEQHEAHAPGTEPNYPLAILIDGGSASASEVVAGALMDRERARLFGSRSYGKGSVQSVIDLSDGSGLKLTVARYSTPSGRVIDGHGIEPQEAVTTAEHGPDAVIAAAEHWVLSAKK